MTWLGKLSFAMAGLWLFAGAGLGAAQSIVTDQISPMPPRKPAATIGAGPQFKPAPGVEPAQTSASSEGTAAAPEEDETATAEPADATSPETIEIAPLDRLQPLAPRDVASPSPSPSAEAEDGIGGDRLATAPAAGTVRTEEGKDRFVKAPFSTPDPMRVERPIAPLPTAFGDSAVIRELDKFSGVTKDVEIAVGTEATVDRLRIRLDGCQAPAANSSQGTMAFLRVWDTKYDSPDPVFHGWMFADSPALSAMDHPRYDVWLISCSAAEGEASAASE